jgi:uncharacterized protein (TIGR02099 family)
MASLKTFLRRAKTLLWTAFSILVVLAAVMMGIGKLLMPYSDRYQPRLEAWLSQEFGQPVVLESFEGEWSAFGPRLSLRGMRLLSSERPSGDDAPGAPAEAAIESAVLEIRPLNALLPGLPLYHFRVVGADFELLRTADKEIRLSGFGVRSRDGQEQGSALRELARVGEVVLEDSSLFYRDEVYGIQLGFRDIRGRLQLDGDELSTDVRASLYDDLGELVFGEIEATALLTLSGEKGIDGAAWQATTREIMLAAFQGRLPPNPFLPLTGWLNAELWGSWSPEEGHLLNGIADLREARLVNDYQDLRLDRVNTRLRWRFQGRGSWQLDLADFAYDDGENSWVAPRLSMARDTAADLGLWISADELPLGMPMRLTRDVLSIYGTPWPAFLPRAASGSVSDLDLILNSRWRLEMARGEVQEASVWDWERWPDLEGLDGRITLDRESGRLALSGDAVRVDWPRMFRDPLTVDISDCALDLRWGRGWQVDVGDCSIENDDLAARGSMLISGNIGKPAVDVNVHVSRGDMGRLDPYWPESILNDAVKSWLRGGLGGGQIRSGRVLIHGDMDQWPFTSGAGRFEAVATVEGGLLKYYEGWPAARDVDVVARFVNAGMDIRGSVGDLGGVPVPRMSATIPSFRAPVLTIDYEQPETTVPALMDFLQRTPLQEQIGADLSRFTFSGAADTRGRITIPFRAAGGALAVAGSVAISNAAFSDPSLDITIGDISGTLDYNERGFTGSNLDAEYRGRPASLALAADADSAEKFRADIVGDFATADVIPEFLLEDFSALNDARGVCRWRGSVIVAEDTPDVLAGGASGGPARAFLEIESELRGVALNLPAPLDKPAGQSWPLLLRYPLAGEERVLDMELADRLALRFDLPADADAPRRAVIRLGGGSAPLPDAGLVRIEGESQVLDLDGWLDVVIGEAMRGRSMGNLALERGNVETAELVFMDRKFADVGLGFSAEGADIQAEFSSTDIDGKVRYTTGAAGSANLSAEFERLALGDPLTTGMEMDTDPADLPALHLYARSFHYAGVDLGETRIEAYPIANGFHFEKIDAASDRLAVQARGDWLLDENGYRSDFDIHMTSESLGDFLQSLDFASPVQGGQTVVSFNAWWPGSPAAFGLSRLNGEVEFSVIDGNITDASAGGGRLLGLLSIPALPKRLALDFRDVFDSGFSFDVATGTFQMENGTASTENVLLQSSAATISISGRTDLVAREYDQLLTIRPGVGNTLPIIGALAAGPGGAAAGLALQGLLHDELAEATQVRYAITGSWDDPVFEPVEVERSDG